MEFGLSGDKECKAGEASESAMTLGHRRDDDRMYVMGHFRVHFSVSSKSYGLDY